MLLRSSILLLLLAFFFSSFRQEVRVGYFSQWVFQPGLSLGFHTSMKSERYIGGQLAYFSQPDVDRNWIPRLEAGKRWDGERKGYQAVGISIGYWRQSELEEVALNLGTGKRENEVRAINHYLCPTIVHGASETAWRAVREILENQN